MVEKIKKRGWKSVVTVITLIALFGLAYFLRDQIYETYTNIQRVYYWVLFLIIPWEILNYYAQTNLFLGLFMAIKTKLVRYKFMFRVCLELNFVNTVFPSGGVSGISYLSVRLKPKGISTAQSTLASLMKQLIIFISFQILMAFGLLLLAVDGKASGLLILITGSIVTAMAIGTLLFAYIIGSKRRINDFLMFFTNILNKTLSFFTKKKESISTERAKDVITELHEQYLKVQNNLHQLKKPLVYGLLANIAEIFVIYTVYVAFGQWVNPGAVIIAYAVANFAGLISVLPGGVGIYEALMTAVLAAGGIPASLSLPVTIMYRILNMAVQLPPGYYFYHQAINRSPNEPR
ncbi:MAG: lysylphosphatidylglycerol synthase transmembrane domain-containing protein [Candidatus Saccharimonadales bacterium]